MAEKGRHSKTSKGLHIWHTASQKLSRSSIKKIIKPLTDFAQKRSSRKIEEQRSLMFLTLDEIPLYAFIRVYCDDDRSALYRNGIRPENAIADIEDEAITNLNLDFVDNINRDAHTLEKTKKRERERLNILILNGALLLIGTKYLDDEIKKELRSMRVRLSGNVDNDKTIIEARLAESVRKFNELNQDNENGTTIDKEWFSKTMASMSVYFKMHIPKEISAKEFCEYVNQFEESIQQEIKANKKHKQKKGSYGR